MRPCRTSQQLLITASAGPVALKCGSSDYCGAKQANHSNHCEDDCLTIEVDHLLISKNTKEESCW